MLLAQTKTQQWISADVADKHMDFFCPDCKAPLVLKKGRVMIPHFAHKTKVDCDSFSEGETLEHLNLKQLLLTWGQQTNPEWRLEEPLAKLKQRPDLLWQQLALEIQCSPLSQERLTVRRKNYRRHGLADWWLLGKKLWPHKRLTTLQKHFCDYTPQWGLHLWLVDITHQQLTLWTHLRKTAAGLQFHKTEIPFFTRPLAELFYSRQQIDRPALVLSPAIMTLKKEQLTRQLWQKKASLLPIQNFFYQQRTHLLYLPSWFYLPSNYQLFFEDQLLVLRYLLANNPTTGLARCEAYFAELPWDFPTIDRSLILERVALETMYLMKNF